MFHRVLLIVMLAIGHCLPALAQHPYYYTVNDDNGLPSNEVYDLAQDPFGYLWVGCDAGLYRYDGFRFTQYRNPGQNAVSISGLRFSPTGKLYCQNFFGQIFSVDEDSMQVFADLKERIRSHPEYAIDCIGNVWIALPDGILKYRKGGGYEYLYQGQLSANEIDVSGDGDVYVVDMTKGLFRISSTGTRTYSLTQIRDNGLLRSSSCTIRPYASRTFILSSNNNTHVHSLSEIKGDSLHMIRTFRNGELAEFIYTISVIGDRIWLCTSNGAYCLTTDGKILDHYFPGEKVSRVFLDQEGTHWFSTLQKGLFAIPHLNVRLLNSFNSSLKDNNVTALRSSGNDILFGTYTGDIYHFAPATNALKLLPMNKGAVYRNVTSIIPYDASTIIACRGGISVMDLRRNVSHDHSSTYIRDMAVVEDSIIHTSTQGISVVTDIPKLVSRGTYNVHFLQNSPGKKVCYDRSNHTLWAMLYNGLASLEGSRFRLFTINGKPVFCNALYADSSGLWVGTVADGVYNIDNNKVSAHLNAGNGLVGNNIKAITSHNGTLYIATDECINIRRPGGQFDQIDLADGINAKEVNALSVNDSLVFVGTIRGLFYLPVTTRFRSVFHPNIRITSVFADSTRYDPLHPLALNYDNRDVLINFSATCLRSRGRFTYKYRITGFQDEWKEQEGSIDHVRLSHLPAGSFTFEVIAVNEDGIPSAQAAVLPITVSAPFWEQWWFYVAIVLLAAALVALLFMLRIRRIRRQGEIMRQLTNSQLTALKAQMNPHFMYNTLNSIQDLVLQNDIKNTNYYLSRYSSLMRKILDTSANKEIELAEEIEILQLYLELEQLRFGSDLSFTIHVSPGIDKAAIHIPTMIVQPFVENAIKHGLLHKKGQKELNIGFALNGNVLQCTIRDNGVGRTRAAEIKQRSPLQHRSFATRATMERLELLNLDRKNKIMLTINDLQDNSTPTGTEVILDIPL